MLELVDQLGVTMALREFDVPSSSFYRWKQKYEKAGQAGLYRERPVAYSHSSRKSTYVVEKILAIRTDHQLGALWIKYYLDRYHGIKISESTVSRVRYAKTIPGHHVQVDVKFLQLKD